MADKMIKEAHERVTSVHLLSKASKDELYRALLAGFTTDKEIFFDSLTKNEIERAESLANERYKKKEWNWMR